MDHIIDNMMLKSIDPQVCRMRIPFASQFIDQNSLIKDEVIMAKGSRRLVKSAWQRNNRWVTEG
jgi:hypothetical protein